MCYIKIRNIFRFSKSAQFQRCFLGRKSPCNYIILCILQENAVIGHPGRENRHITMAIPFASMPPHSSHAQMAARFFGCALIIVPLVRGYMSFRPRMDFDGQNNTGRPSRQSYVKNPVRMTVVCMSAPLWSHEMPSTRVRDKNLMIFNQSKDIEYWAAFQGRLIYLYRLVLLIPENKLPA